MSVLRLKEALEVCSRSFETGDVADTDAAVAGVVGHLASVAESPPPDAEDVLLEIDRFLSSPDSNQMVVDALSLELPEVVIKFVLLSDKCREAAESILDRLVSVGSPREMLSIFCEVLDTHINVYKAAICYTLLLRGLSKVFLCIQRRHVEQVKVALPLILKAIVAVYSESDEEDMDSFNNFFGAVISIGTSIKEICQKLEGRRKSELCAILGLYVLHNIALISKKTESHMVSSCSSLILQLSQFLPFCGFTYYGLLTSFDFGAIAGEQPEMDGDDVMSCFSLSTDGAALAVIWGHVSEEVAKAAGEHAMATLNKIRDDRHGRWKALGSLKSLLPSVDYPWVVKSHSIDLILSMTDGTNPVESNEVPIDFSSLMPSIFAVLKGIQRTMIGAPDASLRKKAFLALKKVVSDLPSDERFLILKALIINSNAPSMIAILIDLVRGEILMESRQKNTSGQDELVQVQNNMVVSRSWGPCALDVVELVLKPPNGGPPTLPDYSEPVLSALNLYRFILILESNAKTNQTGVLSESALRKAYSEWLLPLRTLCSGIQAENEKERDEFAENLLCALVPVQLVLYRCIELVEEKLKHFS